MIDLIEPSLNQEIECLTQAIYHESRSEDFQGQLAVGFVVKNRVLDGRWGSSFCDVIKEPHQFSFYNGRFQRMHEEDAAEKARQIAYTVITSRSPFPQCLLYYHTTSVSPNWDYDKLYEYETIGAHKFYTDNQMECMNNIGWNHDWA